MDRATKGDCQKRILWCPLLILWHRMLLRKGTPREAHQPPRTPEADVAGRALLATTKQHLSDEQVRRTANRIAEQFSEGQARKKLAKAGLSSESRPSVSDMRGAGTVRGDRPRNRLQPNVMISGGAKSIMPFAKVEECEYHTNVRGYCTNIL